MLNINDLIEKTNEIMPSTEPFSESYLFETMETYNSSHASLKIDPENALTFLDIAIPMKTCPIDEGTFYILDLSTVTLNNS